MAFGARLILFISQWLIFDPWAVSGPYQGRPIQARYIVRRQFENLAFILWGHLKYLHDLHVPHPFCVLVQCYVICKMKTVLRLHQLPKTTLHPERLLLLFPPAPPRCVSGCLKERPIGSGKSMPIPAGSPEHEETRTWMGRAQRCSTGRFRIGARKQETHLIKMTFM